MRPERIRGIHDLDMQVGLRRVARVAAGTYLLADPDKVPLTYPDGTGAQVSEYDVAGTAGQLQDHVVAGDGARTSADPRRLAEGDGTSASCDRRATWSGSPSCTDTTLPSAGARMGSPKAKNLCAGSVASSARQSRVAAVSRPRTAMKSVA